MADPILSREAAARIWTAHREIDVGRKLLADIEETKLLDDIEETLAHGGDAIPIDPSDRHCRGYSLGIPSGSGERLLTVGPRLAKTVIEAHITALQAELVAASAAAREALNAAQD